MSEHTSPNDVVEAEIWCGDPGECVNGPDGHLWQDDCRDAWPDTDGAAGAVRT